MIKFVSYGGAPDHTWKSLLDIITFHCPEYSRFRGYADDVVKLMQIFETQGVDASFSFGGFNELEIQFEDPHQELLFKLKYL